jgi:hypothetical protein
MKTIVNAQVTLSRPLEGPLAPHIASFAQWMPEQGTTVTERCRSNSRR